MTEINPKRFQDVATEMLTLGEALYCGSEEQDVRGVGFRMKQLAVHLFGMFPQDHNFDAATEQGSPLPIDRMLHRQKREQ
mgnify:CR=1 FL=1